MKVTQVYCFCELNAYSSNYIPLLNFLIIGLEIILDNTIFEQTNVVFPHLCSDRTVKIWRARGGLDSTDLADITDEPGSNWLS